MHLLTKARIFFLAPSVVIMIIILWPSSPAELDFDRYQLSSSSEFVSALDKAETFSFSHIGLVQGASIQVTTSPRITGQTLGALAEGYDYQNQVFSHSVQPGDTIAGLAAKFNVSQDTILWVNDLAGETTLKEGDQLMILPVSGALHLVRRNETLSQIARDYKVRESEILSFNQISEANEVFVGDILIIPGGQKPAKPQATTRPVASSYFIHPTAGQISQGLHPYNAIDIANTCGTPIYSAASGTVQRTGYVPIGGDRVQILHPNGVVTYYGHLSRILVEPGQQVAQGQEIGRMGSTGYSTGCHLHFDVRGAVNPLAGYQLGRRIEF